MDRLLSLEVELKRLQGVRRRIAKSPKLFRYQRLSTIQRKIEVLEAIFADERRIEQERLDSIRYFSKASRDTE